MKLKLITYREYQNLSNEDKAVYDMVIETLSPSDKVIHAKYAKKFIEISPKHEDIWDFSFADIIDLKDVATKTDIELTKELARIVYRTNIDFISILDLPVFNWIVNALVELIEVEMAELNYEPSEKLKAAGIEELNRFGYLPIIKSLTGGDITKEKEILEKPYHEIFAELAYQNTLNEIQNKLFNVS